MVTPCVIFRLSTDLRRHVSSAVTALDGFTAPYQCCECPLAHVALKIGLELQRFCPRNSRQSVPVTSSVPMSQAEQLESPLQSRSHASGERRLRLGQWPVQPVEQVGVQ